MRPPLDLTIASLKLPAMFSCNAATADTKFTCRGMHILSAFFDLFTTVNFNLSLIVTPNHELGSKLCNGSYTGLKSLIQRKVADVSVSRADLIGVTDDFDFGPVTNEYYQIIFSYVKAPLTDEYGVVKNLEGFGPFFYWTLLLIFLLVFAVLKIRKKSSLMTIFYVLFFQSSIQLRSVPQRIIAIAFMLALVKFFAIFCGKFTTAITIYTRPDEINTLEDVVRLQRIARFSPLNEAYLDFMNGVSESHKQIWALASREGFQNAFISGSEKVVKDVEAARKGTNVNIATSMGVNMFAAVVCHCLQDKWIEEKDKGSSVHISPPFARRSQVYIRNHNVSIKVKERLNSLNYVMFENGILSIGHNMNPLADVLGPPSREIFDCERNLFLKPEQSDTSYKVVTLKVLKDFVALLITIWIIGTGVLLLEVLRYKHQKRV